MKNDEPNHALIILQVAGALALVLVLMGLTIVAGQ